MILARWGGALLALGLGALAALGQAPWALWFVSLPALAGAFWLMAGGPPRRAALLGFAFGAGYFGLALSWIVSPFLIEPEKYGWMAPFALLFMAAGGGLFWGLAAWLGQRGGLLGLVVAFTGVELARGYILTGFPWALIGHVWVDTPLAQMAALVGPSGLTLVTCGIAGLVTSRRWPQGVAAVVMLGAAWGFGAQRLAQPEPVAPGLTLRMVQPNASQVTKWDAGLAQSHFDRLLRLSGGPEVDLVIWPETALPYLIDASPELGPIIGGAAGGAPVVLGLQRTAGVRAWNALAVISPQGAITGEYNKHHLVPFGEYIPFGDLAFDWFGISAFAAQQGHSYSAGQGAAVLDLGPLGKMLPLICYEAVFPQDLRAAPERADWILQITNDAWFGTRSGPFQHLAQAQLRAIEQGLPLVRVANTGITALVDSRGRVTARLPMGAEAALDVALPGAVQAPLYARWGEGPVLLLLAGLAIVTFLRRSLTAA